MYQEKGSIFKRLFRSKLLIAIEIVVLVIFSSALAKEAIRKYQVQNEVEQLQQQLSELEQNNVELGKLVEYFESDIYKEEQARLKLGMQKPGEKIITVLGESTNVTNSVAGISEGQIKKDEENLTNPKKWWNYFFKITKEI